MHIFYASHASPNASIDSQLWRNNLLLPLRDIGHEVCEFEFDWGTTFNHLDTRNPADVRFIESNRPRIESALLEQIRRTHAQKPVELFFSYFYDACAMPATVEAIKAMGIRTVNWYCNGSYQLHLVENLAPHYDFCLVPEKFRLDDYRALGAKPIYCQEAANPQIYHPVAVEKDVDVAFVGQSYGERPSAIAGLVEAGIEVRVWGYGWQQLLADAPPPIPAWRRPLGVVKRALLRQSLPPRIDLPQRVVGGILSDEAMIETFSRAKINLGFSGCGDTHLGDERIVQVRLRDFEVPMCGGFYLVEHMEELGEFFELGKEIETYRDFEEMADKIGFYLAHGEKRQHIADAGHARARRDHTWQKRLADSLAQMERPR